MSHFFVLSSHPSLSPSAYFVGVPTISLLALSLPIPDEIDESCHHFCFCFCFVSYFFLLFQPPSVYSNGLSPLNGTFALFFRSFLFRALSLIPSPLYNNLARFGLMRPPCE